MLLSHTCKFNIHRQDKRMYISSVQFNCTLYEKMHSNLNKQYMYACKLLNHSCKYNTIHAETIHNTCVLLVYNSTVHCIKNAHLNLNKQPTCTCKILSHTCKYYIYKDKTNYMCTFSVQLKLYIV